MSGLHQPTLEECLRYNRRWGATTPDGNRVLPPIAGGADWGLGGGAVLETWGANETISSGTSVGTGTNFKGAVVQLVASTARDCTGLWVRSRAGGSYQLFDILIGPAGSEVVLIPNIVNSGPPFAQLYFPIGIPAGSRISVRAQSSSPDNCWVVVQGVAYGLADAPPFGRVTDYGTSTSTSSGATITANVNNNTFGSWTEIVASTSNPMNFLVWAGFTSANGTGSTGLVQLAIGASGAEQLIATDVPIYASTESPPNMHMPLPSFPVSFPAGTRFSARAMQNQPAGMALITAIYGIE